MERILQKLQHVTETRRQLLLEHASLMETLEEQQAGHIRSLDKNLANTHLMDGCLPSETQKRSPTLYDNGVENLRAKIWEVEKRYALQQLRHEELLLELEGIQKASRQTDSVFSRTDAMFDSKCGLRSELINQPFSDNLGRQAETDMIGRLYNTYPKSKILTIATESSLIHSVQSQLMGRPFSNSQMVPPETNDDHNPDLLELFQTADSHLEVNDIPAPRMIKLERQLTHSVLISWKPPRLGASSQTVSAYHVYVDGQFRMSVKAREKTRALLESVDAEKPHRISVRAICSKGQSKDAECTLVVGRGMTVTPGRLRATQIGTNSAKLSWMPGNSNLCHKVFLNQVELKVCPPGVYKVLLTDLQPDTLHQVCVQAIPRLTSESEPKPVNLTWITSPQSAVDVQRAAAFIEFRTIPIGMPDPPTNVQLEAGPQDGMLLITWRPVQQDRTAAITATAAGTESQLPVQGYTVCLNERALMEVQGAFNDHAIIPLRTLKQQLEHLTSNTDILSAFRNTVTEGVSATSSGPHDVNSGDALQCLFITVHSIVSNSAMDEVVDRKPHKESLDPLKGTDGPASLPIILTPELLISAAGSLESAIRIFGSKISSQIGIDEAASKRAGVPKTTEMDNDTDVMIPTQTEQAASYEPGLLTISASTSERKPSPMSEAVGSAEALLMHRELERLDGPSKTDFLSEAGWHATGVSSKTDDHLEPKNVYASNFCPPSEEYPARQFRLLSPVHRKYRARHEWRNARSISDEYDPRPYNERLRNLRHCAEEIDESLSSTDSQWSEQHAMQTSSLRNLHQHRATCPLRSPGTCSSSWDLRHLPASIRSRLHKKRYVDRILRRNQRTLIHHWVPTDHSHRADVCWSPEHSRWRRLDHDKRKTFSSRFSNLEQHFCSPISLPGPIITALSSSSNEDWHQHTVHKSNTLRTFKDRRFPQEFGATYTRPRSRSVSPVPIGTGHATSYLATARFDSAPRPYNPHQDPVIGFQHVPSRRRSGRPQREQRNTPASGHRIQPVRNPMTTVPEILVYRPEVPVELSRSHTARHMNSQDDVAETEYRASSIPRLLLKRENGSRVFDENVHNPNGTRLQEEVCLDHHSSPIEGHRVLRAGRKDLKCYAAEQSYLPSRDRSKQSVDLTSSQPSNRTHASLRIPQAAQPDIPAMSKTPRQRKEVGQLAAPIGELQSQRKFEEAAPSEMPMRVVVALYTYDPTTMSPNVDAVQEELPFQEGQIIKIFGECDSDGFYLGECNGLRGLVPSNMVSKPENEASRRAVNKALTDKSAGNIGNRLETGTIPPGQRSKPRSTESINPRRHRIPALPDDPVEYMETNQQTHSALFTDATECGPPCRARIRRSADQPLVGHRATVNGQSRLQFGSVPTARYESAQRPSSSRSRPNDSAKQQGIGWRQHMNLEKRPMLAVYDYDPSVLSPNADADEMELSFRTGDLINVYGGMDEDGFYYGETEDGRRGLVPSNFLREIAESTDGRHTLPDSRENRSYLNMDQTRASGFGGRYNSQGASSIEEDRQSRNENVQHHRTSVSSS